MKAFLAKVKMRKFVINRLGPKETRMEAHQTERKWYKRETPRTNRNSKHLGKYVSLGFS